MRLSLAVAIVVLAGATAHAGVGVVVTGDPVLGVRVAAHLESWLEKHGHKLVESPLPAEAINQVLDCLVTDDQKCMHQVIDARSKSKTVVFARVDLTDRKSKDITFTLLWFDKGHEPISERRVCEGCEEDRWQSVTSSMMAALSGSSQAELGRLVLTSDPPGLMVMLDNVQVGVTPIESDLPAGDHTVKLAHAGRTVGKKKIAIQGGETTTVRMHADVEIGRSRLVPALLITGGAITAATGGAFLYRGQSGGLGDKYIYPDATPVGIGLGFAGVGFLVTGIILLAQKPSSTPVVAVGAHEAFVGWATGF